MFRSFAYYVAPGMEATNNVLGSLYCRSSSLVYHQISTADGGLDEYVHSRWLFVSGGGINFPGGYNYGDARGGLFGNRHCIYRWFATNVYAMYFDDGNMYRHSDQPAFGYASGGVKYDVGTVSIGSPTGYHYQQRGHNFICGFSWQNPGHEPGLFTTQEDNESSWTGEVREVIGSLQRLSFSRQC